MIERIEVYNLMGQNVFTEIVDRASDKVQVDLNRIHTGMYLVNIVFTENQISIQKLIVE